MASQIPMYDVHQRCNLYVAHVSIPDTFAVYLISTAAIALIFFGFFVPVMVSLQPRHRRKRIARFLLRHKNARFVLWPYLPTCCLVLLVLQAIVLHAGLTCGHHGHEKKFLSLKPAEGWIIFSLQVLIVTFSSWNIRKGLKRAQRREQLRNGQIPPRDLEQSRGEAIPMLVLPPPEQAYESTIHVLRGVGDNCHSNSTTTTTTITSNGRARPEYFCWQGYETLTGRSIDMVGRGRPRRAKDANPGLTHERAPRRNSKTLRMVTTEDRPQPTHVRLPSNRNGEGSSRDIKQEPKRNSLAADVEGFPFPLMPPPPIPTRAAARGADGGYIPLASGTSERHPRRPPLIRLSAPSRNGKYAPAQSSPLSRGSGFPSDSEEPETAVTVPGGCRLDRIRGRPSESVVFDLPPGLDAEISLSRATTVSRGSSLPPLERCPRPASPRRLSLDSAIELDESVCIGSCP